MATNVTLITGEGATSYTVSTGSRGPTGATGAAGLNTITTATTTPLVGFLSGNGATVTASTSATFVSGSQAIFESGSVANFTSGSIANFAEESLRFDGNDFITKLNFVDPSVDQTITLPDATGTVALTNDPRFTDARTPTAHTHGNISNVGTIGSTATLPLITTTAGVITTGTFGTTAGTFTQGNDARLSDARTPLAHTHEVSDIVSVTSQRLIGRHAGGAGAGQEIQASGGVEFSGDAIQRSALTGDITASAGSNATTLAATIAGNKTFSGDLTFSSTTRPTSGGTEATLVGTSLITYDDAETLILRDGGGWLTHRIDNFETAMLTSVGGTAGFNSTTGGVDRPAMSYRPSNTVDGAANHQALIGLFLNLSTGSLRHVKNWSKRSRLSFSTMQASLSAGTTRFYWGPQASAWAGGDLLVRGFGFEVIANSVFAVAHDGTSKTTSGTSVALTFQVRVQLAIESDGVGGIRWYVNNVEQTPITGGPTGNSVGTFQFGFCTQAVNPTPATNTFVYVNNLLLASKM